MKLNITEQDLERAKQKQEAKVDFEAWRHSWRGKPRFKGAVSTAPAEPERESNAEEFLKSGRARWLNPAESNSRIMIILPKQEK